MNSLAASLSLDLLPFSEWVHKLEESLHHDPEALKRNPALALLDFYKRLIVGFDVGGAAVHGSDGMEREAGGLARLGTEKAIRASPSLDAAPVITREDVDRWVAYWRAKGFLRE